VSQGVAIVDVFLGEGEGEVATLRRGNLLVQFWDAGEGLCEDYDPDDADDVHLLRFDVMVDEGGEQGLTAVDDASYCTNTPASTSPDDLRRLLTMLMDEVYENVTSASELHIKKLCERLSWIGPDWLTSNV